MVVVFLFITNIHDAFACLVAGKKAATVWKHKHWTNDAAAQTTHKHRDGTLFCGVIVDNPAVNFPPSFAKNSTCGGRRAGGRRFAHSPVWALRSGQPGSHSSYTLAPPAVSMGVLSILMIL